MAVIVKGNSKVPFSIATIVGKGATPFLRLLPFTVDTYSGLSVKQGDIKHRFLSLWYDLTWD